MAFAVPLVASCNFSRQYAELIDVPIANEHLDSGCHRLIVGVSLGLASSLQRPQMLEFEHTGWCISVVSHDPSPLTMHVANFGAKHGGEWAPSRRNLGSLFVCKLIVAHPHKDSTSAEAMIWGWHVGECFSRLLCRCVIRVVEIPERSMHGADYGPPPDAHHDLR